MTDDESRRDSRSRPAPTSGTAEEGIEEVFGAGDEEPRAADGASGGRTTAIITQQEAAQALIEPTSLRRLAPFIGRTLSVTQAAEMSGEKPNTTLKRVRRFRELGLLKVAAVVPRAGRSIKLYRAVADTFFVPFEATDAESLEVALAERDRFAEDLLRRNVVKARLDYIGTWGTRIYRDARGRLQVQTALTPNSNVTSLDAAAPAVLSAWRDSLTLDFEDAKALQGEMFALLQRYLKKDGAQRYVVHLALAPVQP